MLDTKPLRAQPLGDLDNSIRLFLLIPLMLILLSSFDMLIRIYKNQRNLGWMVALLDHDIVG
ncbi:MAG TPA: hypothetical protein PLI52_04850 [Prochlorococcaceae cyanobacterium AMR_MDS_5431]|nr:hypothetical protein [Prochlorococcaceae cyanobacterium AMR_MDS_5431]